MLKGITSGKYPGTIGDYELVHKTDTTAFYSNGTEIVMAVRGTRPSHLDDVSTAISTVYNGIPNSKLYKEDAQAVIKMRELYPGLPVHGVGHSLGGAIIDSLMDEGLIDSGHSYNPAVQPRHLINPTNQSRTYNEGDILHKLYDLVPIAVPNQQILPSQSIVTNPIQAHNLESFTGGSLPGFLCRVGSKKRFAKLLAHIAPPHETYVEPFVGSGAFYWYKEPSTKEVVNDLEPDIAETFRLIKEAPTNLNLYPQNLDNKAKMKKFFLEKHSGVANELTRMLIKHCGGWMGKPVSENTGTVVRETNPFNKLKHIADYKERMKNTTVLSEDYAKVIQKYNKPDTFFFLDPPYENSEGFGYAEESSFDFEKLKATVGTIKGNWLMTINDSPNIRSLFKAYHLYPVLIIGHKRKTESGTAHIGSKDRAELLISNYKIPMDWKAHSGKALVGKGCTQSRAVVAPTPAVRRPIHYTHAQVTRELNPLISDFMEYSEYYARTGNRGYFVERTVPIMNRILYLRAHSSPSDIQQVDIALTQVVEALEYAQGVADTDPDVPDESNPSTPIGSGCTQSRAVVAPTPVAPTIPAVRQPQYYMPATVTRILNQILTKFQEYSEEYERTGNQAVFNRSTAPLLDFMLRLRNNTAPADMPQVNTAHLQIFEALENVYGIDATDPDVPDPSNPSTPKGSGTRRNSRKSPPSATSAPKKKRLK